MSEVGDTPSAAAPAPKRAPAPKAPAAKAAAAAVAKVVKRRKPKKVVRRKKKVASGTLAERIQLLGALIKLASKLG